MSSRGGDGEVAVIRIEEDTERGGGRGVGGDKMGGDTCLCIPKRKERNGDSRSSRGMRKSGGGGNSQGGLCGCSRFGNLFGDCWSDLTTRKFSLTPPQEFHIDNSHPLHYRWLTLVTIAALYNVVFVVGRAFFWELDEKWPKLWTLLDALSDFIYLTDMLVHAHEGYLEEGLMVKDPRKLRRNYFHSPHFKLDLVSILPTEIVSLCIASATPASSDSPPWPPPVPRPVIARLNRLARLPRANDFFSKTETRTPHPNAFRIAKVLGTTLLLIHWNACAYFALSCFLGFGSDGWVYGGVPAHQRAANLQMNSLATTTTTTSNPVSYDASTGRSTSTATNSVTTMDNATMTPTTQAAAVPMSRAQAVRLTTTLSHQYIYSFYWSTLTLTTIGETPPPETELEHVFVALDFLAGVLIFATIVGNVGTMVSGAGAARMAFRAKCDSVKRYLTLRKVSKELEDRVIRWFDYVWASRQALMDEEEGRVLSSLPPHLRSEIALHVHLDTLRQVRIFQDAEPGLLAELVLKLRLQVFSPGDYVCRKGDVGRELYIVKRGRLHVVASPGAKKKKKRPRTEAEKIARRERRRDAERRAAGDKVTCEKGGSEHRRRKWWGWWWYGCCPGGCCCGRLRDKSLGTVVRNRGQWGNDGRDRGGGILSGLKYALRCCGLCDRRGKCRTISDSGQGVGANNPIPGTPEVKDEACNKTLSSSDESSENEEEETVQATLGAGSVFGEVALLEIPGTKTGNRRTASVRSVGYSDLFCLSKADLWAALEEYPAARRRLSERSRRILAKDGLLTDKKSEGEEKKEIAASKPDNGQNSGVPTNAESKEINVIAPNSNDEPVSPGPKKEAAGQSVIKHVRIGKAKVGPSIEGQESTSQEVMLKVEDAEAPPSSSSQTIGNAALKDVEAIETESDMDEKTKTAQAAVRSLGSPEEKDSSDEIVDSSQRQSAFQSDDDDDGQNYRTREKNLEDRVQHIEELLENLQLRFARLMAEFCSSQAKVKQRLAVIEQSSQNIRASSTKTISQLDRDENTKSSSYYLSPASIMDEAHYPRQSRQSSV